MQNRWLFAALIASIALNVGVVGFYIYERASMAPPPPPLPGMGPAGREHMRRMRTMFEPRMDSLREELMSTRLGLMKLVREPQVEQNKADSLLREIGRIEQQMNRLAFENARRLVDSLPPDMRQRFFERLEQGGGPGGRPWSHRRGHMQGQHGPGPGFPGGR